MEDYEVHLYEQLLTLVQMRMEPRDDLLYAIHPNQKEPIVNSN
jgi:hypothetical protein